jgi:hypothetical protein
MGINSLSNGPFFKKKKKKKKKNPYQGRNPEYKPAGEFLKMVTSRGPPFTTQVHTLTSASIKK